MVETIDASGSQVDVGYWTMEDDYWLVGNITTFTVEALSEGVGAYPVKYRFHIVPNGEICQKCYVQITIPSEIEVVDKSSLEFQCGTDLQDFLEDSVDCSLDVDNPQILNIYNGFQSSATTNLTDSDGWDNPPDLYITLDHFRNPRLPTATSPWNVTIYNKTDEMQYSWNETSPTGPTTRIGGTAVPSRFVTERLSKSNGNITDYEFTIETTNYVQTGDQIYITLPDEASFSEDTECFGRSNNLDNVLDCAVAINLRMIKIDVKLADWLEEKGRRRLGQIAPGDSYRFRLTNVRNPSSYRPTDSMIYQIFTENNVLFEELTFGLEIVNEEPGELSVFKNGITPYSFESDILTNYTLELLPVNYEKNMNILLTLPPFQNETQAIHLPSEEIGVKCYGEAGTDVAGQEDNSLACTVDYETKTINITDAVQYQNGNPGVVRIKLTTLRNPVENIITESFTLRTETSDGFTLDFMDQNMTINFYCKFPCASCEQDFPEVCQSCYSSADQRFFFEDMCYDICPDGWVNTTTNNCTDCLDPCATCAGGPDLCLTCIEGWKLIEGTTRCREIVLWPFPFLIFAIISFIVILISEILTKGESRFKEAFIAALSIPEFLSWGTLLGFMAYRIGTKGPTALIAVAIIFYMMINVAHAIVHPRQMHPNSLPTYKELYVNYPCGTCMARFLSYLFSFKFSLILVSWFCLSKRLKGDYSAMNWKQFNRFSIAFILLPYPTVMFGCCYFVYKDGLFSYPGFICMEVITLSTLLATLMALDALSAIKCKTVGKEKTQKVFKVQTGADYESDEDIVTKQGVRKSSQMNRRQNLRLKSGFDEDYGDEDNDSGRFDDSKRGLRGKQQMDDDDRLSHVSHMTGVVDEDTKKQVQMLEELAKQMRMEKLQIEEETKMIRAQQAQVDADKLALQEERQRLGMQRETQEYRLDGYMQEHARQTTALSDSVRELERQKHDLVNKIEDRLSMGAGETRDLAQQIERDAGSRLLAADAGQTRMSKTNRRNFRDFEGEMEEYEPVAEENSRDEDDSEVDRGVEDTFVDRMTGKPAFGEIDYYRQVVGEEEQWMQQITPRAGGDSMLGQHDVDDAEGMVALDKNFVQEFDEVSRPPTKDESQLEVGVAEAHFHEDENVLEENVSEQYQNRSDAEMEELSDADEKKATQQQFFNKEQAVFSELGEEAAADNETAQELFNQILEPVCERVPDYEDLHAVEQQYFNQPDASDGETNKNYSLRGSMQEFFNQEKATIEDVARDNENDIQKTATLQQFFTNEQPVEGDADDKHRAAAASDIEAIEKELPAYSEIPDAKSKQDDQQRMFNQDRASQGNATDLNRSVIASQQMYQERPHALASQDEDGARDRRGSQQEYFENEAGRYSQAKTDINKTGYNEEFFKNDEAVRGDVTSNDRSVLATQQNYFTNVRDQEFGQEQDYDKSVRRATQQNYFENVEKKEFGQPEDYMKSLQASQEYQPAPEVDASGASASSEGDIADHGLFNADSGFIGQNTSQQQPGGGGGPGGQGVQRAPDNAAQQIDQPGRRKTMKAKQILYSDKSETSVEDLMDDTPSNYNIQNGRFEGKSLGLKALLLHAKNQNQTLDPTAAGSMGSGERRPTVGERSPQASSNSKNLISSGLAAAQRGIIGSQNDEKAFINNLYANKKMTGVIGEVSSANEAASAAGTRNNRNQVKTTKQFAEDPNGASNRTPAPGAQGAAQTRLQKNNFVKK